VPLTRIWLALGLIALVATSRAQSAVQTPPPLIDFPAWKPVETTDEATEYEVAFPSAVVSRFPVNNMVPLRIFIPQIGKGPFPVVLVLHYWGATDLRPERSLASELARRGIASALMTLPYHLTRTPPGMRSGQLAIEPDVARLKLTTIQSVLDVRRSIDYLATRPELDVSRLGISGTSLGALVTALSFAVDSRIQYAAFLLGGADFANILWNSSRVVLQRDALRRQGYTEEKLAKELTDIEPLTYLPQRKEGHTFIISAKFDTVVPKQATDELVAALPDPKVLYLETGHYGGIFVQRRLMREVANYFGAEFGMKPYAPPGEIYAPTLRVGIRASAPDGFDLAAGIDLLKFDRKGDAFASLLVTPRGPSLFLGRKFTPVISIGAFASPKSFGVGIFWSTVL
jgi:cephalosporin-C deacetylase-like acetyl esterase